MPATGQCGGWVVRWGGMLAVPLLALGGAPKATAWGPPAHQLINRRAIDALPKELKPFYQAHWREMATFSPEGPPEEGVARRFAADRFGPFPFLDLPTDEAELDKRFPDAKEAGRLPWLILESYDRLVSAYRSGDKAAILQQSDDLAGLVADLHNPLALTVNADGQRSDQAGLWTRFSMRLPEVYQGRLSIDSDAAYFIDSPKSYVFSTLRFTYVWADNVVYEEGLAARGQPLSSALYYETLAERMKPIVKLLWSRAARDVASFWYTAWVSAGRPTLPVR